MVRKACDALTGASATFFFFFAFTAVGRGQIFLLSF